MKRVMTIMGLVWTLLTLCSGGATFFYFVGANGSLDPDTAPMAMASGIAFLFCFIPLIRKLVRLSAVSPPPAAKREHKASWEEAENSFDADAADAAIARYLAQHSSPDAPAEMPKAFGRKR